MPYVTYWNFTTIVDGLTATFPILSIAQAYRAFVPSDVVVYDVSVVALHRGSVADGAVVLSVII